MCVVCVRHMTGVRVCGVHAVYDEHGCWRLCWLVAAIGQRAPSTCLQPRPGCRQVTRGASPLPGAAGRPRRWPRRLRAPGPACIVTYIRYMYVQYYIVHNYCIVLYCIVYRNCIDIVYMVLYICIAHRWLCAHAQPATLPERMAHVLCMQELGYRTVHAHLL